MNIFGYTDDYALYSKIPISAAEWLEEYEYNIDDLYSRINLGIKPCKILRRGTDMLWLQEYLRMITQYTTRMTNSGETYTDEDLFALFKLPLVRNRTLCKYSIDIYDGMDSVLREAIKSQDECFLNNQCNDVFYYREITNDDDTIDILMYSNDIFSYGEYIPYRKTGTILSVITYSYDEDGLLIPKAQESGAITAADIVLKKGYCFYADIGLYVAPCASTATGVYQDNGDFVVTMDPLTVSNNDFTIMLDGVERVIDGTEIIYANGILTIKEGYKYNRISLSGCPVLTESIVSPCNYTFTLAQTSTKITITIGGSVLPVADELSLLIDNATFPTENYTYNANTGVIEIDITAAYYNHPFSIKAATCTFNFVIIDSSGNIEVIVNPTINTYTYFACDGCDYKEIEVSYILDSEAAVENTYKSVETVINTTVNGCRESYIKYDYYCSDSKKYLVTTEYSKCYGDTSWTEGTPSEPEEQVDPGECVLPTAPEGEIYDECDGADLYTHTITYEYNETTNSYDETDTITLKTANGCKETYSIVENICVNGVSKVRTTVYTKNFGDELWTAGEPTLEDGGTADCIEEISGLVRCNSCNKETYTKIIKYDTDAHSYAITENITDTDVDGCKETYTITKYVCLAGNQAQQYDKTCYKCFGDSVWTCGSWTPVGSPSAEPKCGDGSEGLLVDPEP